MSAVMGEERRVVIEDRIARLESDVTEVKGDVKVLNTSLNDFKTEVAKEFGSLRTSIERMKVWVLGTGISTVLGIAAVIGLKLH